MVLAELGQGWQGFPLQQIKASGEAGEAGGLLPGKHVWPSRLQAMGLPAWECVSSPHLMGAGICA